MVSDQPGILLKKSISGEQSMPGPCTVDSSCRSLARTHFAGLRTKAGELYIDDTAWLVALQAKRQISKLGCSYP